MTRRLTLAFAALNAAAVLWGAGAETATFAVIVNRDVPVSNLSVTELRKIYLGDKQFWKPSMRIVPLIRTPVTRERAAVVWTVCKMTEADFNRHWIGKMMRAESTSSPRQFSTNPAAVNLVNNLAGAIAIVNATQLPESDGIRILKIDGKVPGDPDYALRFQD
jgi:hypothetical protein